MNEEQQEEERDDVIEKIKEIYSNYGIDISDMSDEEFTRLKDGYSSRPGSLEKDLKGSKKFKGSFEVII